jgi:hypothetical protein
MEIITTTNEIIIVYQNYDNYNMALTGCSAFVIYNFNIV